MKGQLLMQKKLSPLDQKKTLFIVSFIMFVNALSYGTIIPLLYAYSDQFQIGPLGLSLLFSSFSLFQFISNPIIGRLSDKYGRKPLLLLSIFGTSISFAIIASAQTAFILFLGRILDGVTGGNIAVAQATLADTRSEKERNRAFGIMWAAFGLGFAIGPAIGGLLSVYGLSFPFWIGAGIAFINTILCIFLLKETHTPDPTIPLHKDVFEIIPMWQSLFLPIVGKTLIATLLIGTALHSFIIGYQTYAVDRLMLEPLKIGILFSGFGLVSSLVRAIGINKITSFFGSELNVLRFGSLIAAFFLLPLGFTPSIYIFAPFALGFMTSRAPFRALIPSFISKNSPPERRGQIMGIEQAYDSLGKIVGPLLAGLVALFWIPGVFITAGACLIIAFLVVKSIVQKPVS